MNLLQADNARYERDPARYVADNVLRASDEMCMWCRVEDCPAAFGGGFCPLDEAEEDHRENEGRRRAAQNGTL